MNLKEVDKAIKLIEYDSPFEYTPFTLRFRVKCLSCEDEFLSPNTSPDQFCSEECKSLYYKLVGIVRLFERHKEGVEK